MLPGWGPLSTSSQQGAAPHFPAQYSWQRVSQPLLLTYSSLTSFVTTQRLLFLLWLLPAVPSLPCFARHQSPGACPFMALLAQILVHPHSLLALFHLVGEDRAGVLSLQG